MIYLTLFLTFFEVGAFTFGGGYAMISLIREKVTSHGWMSEEELLNMIAVSESTPGPIAVNMATFVGSSEAGALGAVVATLGVVLPSFLIILAVASLVSNLMKYGAVKAALGGIRPCVVALILGSAVTMISSNIFGFSRFGDVPTVDVRALIIFIAVMLSSLLIGKIRGKSPSPILLILISAVLGVVLY